MTDSLSQHKVGRSYFRVSTMFKSRGSSYAVQVTDPIVLGKPLILLVPHAVSTVLLKPKMQHLFAA